MEVIVKAKTREGGGSAVARRLRRDGRLPGVMYNERGESRLIELNTHDFEQMLHHHRSESMMVTLELDGASLGKVLLKEVQHDPLSDSVIHVDLAQISLTKKMRVEIPLILVGDPKGVTQQGGVLEQALRHVDVECLPTDLVESFSVDVSGLELNHSLMVSGLNLDPKFVILTDAKLAVASVALPRQEQVAPEAEAAAVPERPGEKKDKAE